MNLRKYMSRKYMSLLVGGGICLLLVVVAVTMLVRFRQGYSRANANLDAKVQRLNALNRRDPFPSPENVSQSAKNAEVQAEFFEKLLNLLRHEELEPEEMEPAEFPTMVERTVRELQRRAGVLRAKLPDRFAFGFTRYFVEGGLPEDGDIPRLVVQLKAVDQIFKILFTTKVSEVIAFKREEFEQRETAVAEETSTSRRDRRLPRGPAARTADAAGPQRPQRGGGAGMLYEKEHFTISFVARESSVWELLNRLARSRMLTVVTRVEMETKAGPLQGATRPAAAAGAPGSLASRLLGGGGTERPQTGPLPHDERVVAGREEVTVKLEMDVYRFVVPEEEGQT